MAENCKKRPGSDELCDGFVCGQNIKKNSINADRLNDESFEAFLKWVLTCKFGDAAWFRDVICNIGCEGVRCNLELDPSGQVNLDQDGFHQVIITSEKSWSASTNDTWYQIVPSSAAGTAVVQIDAGPYEGRLDRIGTMFVKGCDDQRIVPLTVYQRGGSILTMDSTEKEYPSGEVACYTFRIATNLNRVKLELNNRYAYFSEIRQIVDGETETTTLTGMPREQLYNVIGGDPGREKSFLLDVDVCMTVNVTEAERRSIFTVSGSDVAPVSATLIQGATEETHLTVECPAFAQNLPVNGDNDDIELTISANKGNTSISVETVEELSSYLYFTHGEDTLTFAWDDTDDASSKQTITLHAPTHIEWNRMQNI